MKRAFHLEVDGLAGTVKFGRKFVYKTLNT